MFEILKQASIKLKNNTGVIIVMVSLTISLFLYFAYAFSGADQDLRITRNIPNSLSDSASPDQSTTQATQVPSSDENNIIAESASPVDQENEDMDLHGVGGQSNTQDITTGDTFYTTLISQIVFEENTGDILSKDGESVRQFSCTKYIVQSGDSLNRIANRYGITLDTLLSINDIREGRLIRPRTELLVPNQSGIMHTVSRGESISVIARKYDGYDVSAEAIMLINGLQPDDILRIGDKLFIPGARLSSKERDERVEFDWSMPVNGVITSVFGWRENPFNRGRREMHKGLDIAARTGEAVRAVKEGVVIFAGWKQGYGNLVILRHAQGFSSRYGHLSRITVRVGENVSRLERIGLVGSSGRSTGPHLHLEIRKNNDPINPSNLSGLHGSIGSRFRTGR